MPSVLCLGAQEQENLMTPLQSGSSLHVIHPETWRAV
jgi:hypothetical protein